MGYRQVRCWRHLGQVRADSEEVVEINFTTTAMGDVGCHCRLFVCREVRFHWTIMIVCHFEREMKKTVFENSLLKTQKLRIEVTGTKPSERQGWREQQYPRLMNRLPEKWELKSG
jgi:hypothetical protein